MGIRTTEEQVEMVLACLKRSSVQITEMAKLLKLDNKTFKRKVRNQSFNLFEVVVFANYCGLDMKELVELFFPRFSGNHKDKGCLK
nr:MAG TPA: Regulatory protein-modification, helix-turn-helix, transcriptional regulator, DNA [Caudoviricetes sp.]